MEVPHRGSRIAGSVLVADGALESRSGGIGFTEVFAREAARNYEGTALVSRYAAALPGLAHATGSAEVPHVRHLVEHAGLAERGVDDPLEPLLLRGVTLHVEE
eukprot:854466-Pyramimonas_sp.AAC.1